jgi:hypothetical protein
MRYTLGNTANTVIIAREILTVFDSSSQTYERTCPIGSMIPATRENIPVICDEEEFNWIVDTDRSQCHIIQAVPT